MKGPHLLHISRDAGLNCMGLGRGSQSTPAVQADRCRKAEKCCAQLDSLRTLHLLLLTVSCRYNEDPI
jgi:hypothetical protein